MADHDARDVRERLDVVLDPLDVHDVEVVRGLVLRSDESRGRVDSVAASRQKDIALS